MACGQTGMACDGKSSGSMERCGIRPEVGIIDPHRVQDHADMPGQSNPSRRLLANDWRAMQGALGTATAGDLRSPCSQPCRAPTNRRENSPLDCFLTLLIHHHGRGLTQCAAQVDIAGLGNAARDVAFTGLVS